MMTVDDRKTIGGERESLVSRTSPSELENRRSAHPARVRLDAAVA
jgi:hypothetical protein